MRTEIASEFAKDLVMEERFTTMKNQVYILGKQLHRIKRLENKVDVIITDSPLLFSILYKPDWLSVNFENLVLELFNSFDNINYLVERYKKYDNFGRIQSENEAIKKDKEIKFLLDKNKIGYNIVDGKRIGTIFIVQDVIKKLSKEGG